MKDQYQSGFRIAEVARLVDASPSTLRRLDALGLVAPRRTWGAHRRYSTEDIECLRELAVTRRGAPAPKRKRRAGGQTS